MSHPLVNKGNNNLPSPAPKIIPFHDIEQSTKDPTFDLNLIEAIAQGFCDFSCGKFNLCPIQTIGAPPMAPLLLLNHGDEKNYCAQVCIKSGYITNDKYFVIKVASGGHPLENSGLMQLYLQSTGRLVALLMDEGLLTELRTAAVGAVAVKYLGPPEIKCIGIVGTGIQARYQLRYLKQVTDCRNLIIWGRSPSNMEILKEELTKDDEWSISLAQTTKELLESCNIIITTTCAREALLDGASTTEESNRSCSLIVCIGSDSVGKQELSVNLVSSADFLVCDSILQTQERGEFQHAIHSKEVKIEDIKELGHVLTAKKKEGIARDNSNADPKLTIFDSSGVAVQDCVVAKIVYDSLSDASTA